MDETQGVKWVRRRWCKIQDSKPGGVQPILEHVVRVRALIAAMAHARLSRNTQKCSPMAEHMLQDATKRKHLQTFCASDVHILPGFCGGFHLERRTFFMAGHAMPV